MRQIKKLMQRGLLDPEQEDPFSLFVASTNIRYCFYSETHKILGNTYGMCVLQVREISEQTVITYTLPKITLGNPAVCARPVADASRAAMSRVRPIPEENFPRVPLLFSSHTELSSVVQNS